jgi:hypothetical protein
MLAYDRKHPLFEDYKAHSIVFNHVAWDKICAGEIPLEAVAEILSVTPESITNTAEINYGKQIPSHVKEELEAYEQKGLDDYDESDGRLWRWPMQWTKYENALLRSNWEKCPDKVLASIFNVSAPAIRAQRRTLGLLRKPPPGFVVQVTNWLSELAELNTCIEDFREHGVEYIVVKQKGQYALFRKYTGAMSVGAEPPRSTWVDHWVPADNKCKAMEDALTNK